MVSSILFGKGKRDLVTDANSVYIYIHWVGSKLSHTLKTPTQIDRTEISHALNGFAQSMTILKSNMFSM